MRRQYWNEPFTASEKCPACGYEGHDFRFYPKSWTVICPKCKTRFRMG